MLNLFESVHSAWLDSDVDTKLSFAMVLPSYWEAGLLNLKDGDCDFEALEPGLPARPAEVSPQQVEKRSAQTVEGRAALIHAIAHIEFNAVNLALDAVWRFRSMPREYYADWLRIASEEAQHFAMLRAHLRTLGFDYGSFPAHRGLWDVARRTSHDVLARMALVPRFLEARGLDATPAIQKRLAEGGDATAAAILDIIMRDEIVHVATGNRWFSWLCDQRDLDPVTHFVTLLREFDAPKIKGWTNVAARTQAGFTSEDLDALRAYAAEH